MCKYSSFCSLPSSVGSRDAYLAQKPREWNVEFSQGEAKIAHLHGLMSRRSTLRSPIVALPRLRASASLNERHSAFHSLAQQMVASFGLADSWRIAYDSSRARAGLCNYQSHTLSFSRNLVAKAEPHQWIDTIAHEIAHALVGPRHGHNFTWQRVCRAIGGTGLRCHNLVLARPLWTMVCVAGCSWSRPCFRRSLLNKKPRFQRCGTPCKYLS